MSVQSDEADDLTKFEPPEAPAGRYVHGARTWGYVEGGFRKLTCPLGHNLKNGMAIILGQGVLRCRFRPAAGTPECGLLLYALFDVRNNTLLVAEVDDDDMLEVARHTTVNETLGYLGCIPKWPGVPPR